MPSVKMDEIFQRYYEKSASEAEIQELMQWMADPANEAELIRLMRDRWEALEPGAQWLPAEKSAAMLAAILPAEGEREKTPRAKIIRFWLRVAAAVIILLIAGGAWFWIHHRALQIAVIPAQPPEKNDVQPGGNRATLVLANGSTIVLDSAGRGLLAQQGSTSVSKTSDGQLVYNGTREKNAAGFNTVSTPRGGRYQVVLPDGSKVWLNAASSLRFPTAFTNAERTVELTGEAYFEVTHHAEKPFLVAVNGMTVKVLGTHFNVMAYDEEAAIKTSLLEGKVKVSFAGREVSLAPSEQSSLEKAEAQLSVDKNADLEKAVAWKDGLFYFENDDIQTIMRQLARWYDVKVIYSAPIRSHYYSGQIRTQVPLSDALHRLELVGHVKFQIDGKTVSVETY